MIQIEEPPSHIEACSTCMKPITWIYAFHLSRTIGVVPVTGEDRWTFRLHTCRLDQERSKRPWRYVQTQAPETARRGAKRVRAVLAAKKNITEKESA